MTHREPHEDQSSTQVLVILGFLSCLAVVLLSVGIFGLRAYTAKRAAIEAELLAKMQAEKALADARLQADQAISEALESDRAAKQAIRQAELAEPKEIETDQ